jgi:hypothetical protein
MDGVAKVRGSSSSNIFPIPSSIYLPPSSTPFFLLLFSLSLDSNDASPLLISLIWERATAAAAADLTEAEKEKLDDHAAAAAVALGCENWILKGKEGGC